MKIAQPALMIQDKPTPVQNDWHTLRQCQTHESQGKTRECSSLKEAKGS